ncbi:MAG: DEAD/DEAH box helicase [Bacteroidaceae bacterium]|nr:DEAD/DEAH box helicase [Bacteroidaceae bacterium]
MASSEKKKTSKKKGKKKIQRVPYYSCPSNMTIEEWQIALRRQMAREERYTISSVDEEKLPGEYLLENPKTRRQYKVVYRGAKSPWNYCSCMDFKTSRLGTCKHIEAVKQKVSGSHLKVHTVIPSYTSVYLDYRGERAVRIRIGSDYQEEYQQLASHYFDAEGKLLPSAFKNIHQFIRAAKAIDDSFRFYQDALDFVIEQREQNVRERIIHNYSDEELDSILHTSLYPYQKEGVRFAFAKGKSIIADEMGLGKTVQAIATAELLLREHLADSVLVICPTSLKYQWKREIERLSGQEAHVIEGSHLQRRDQYNAPQPYKIISYNSACNDIKILGKLQTGVLIMDEVQRLKNWNTQISAASRRIQSDYSVILSGTPLENKLEELFSVMQLVDQFCLAPYYQFRAQCIQTDELGKIIGYKNLNRVGEIIRERLIRRRKKDVALQMPKRQDKNLIIPITQQQMDIHEEFRAGVARLIQKWAANHFLSEKDRKHLLLLLSQMRMVCDSTYILDQKTRYDTKVNEVMNILQNVVDSGDEKVVVFSQWERMTRLVAQELDKRDIGYEYLHGGVPSVKRKDLVSNFSDLPESRVFLSTDAGSTGLNLQAASIVINLDLPWNPAVLEQRIARIYRLGQIRNIQVINLVAKDTFEEQMIGKLRFKTSMFEGVLDGGEDSVFVEDNKFSQMMDTLKETMDVFVEETAEVSEQEPVVMEEPEEEKDKDSSKDTGDASEVSPDLIVPQDEDEEPFKPSTSSNSSHKSTVQSPKDLLSQGISFMTGLAETLKSPEATEELIKTIVVEDEKTGETSIHIPIANKQSVKNLLQLVGKLFG